MTTKLDEAAKQDFKAASVATVPWGIDGPAVVETETKLLNGVYVIAGMESDAGQEVVVRTHVGKGRAAIAANGSEAVNLADLAVQGDAGCQHEQ